MRIEKEINNILNNNKTEEIKILRIKKIVKTEENNSSDVNSILEHIRLYENKVITGFKCLKRIDEIIHPF